MGSECQGPDWGSGSWMQWASNQENQGGVRGPSQKPALVELQGSDQAFPLITNRQNMSRTLPGPSTPHPELNQEGIFKGQEVCQRDIHACRRQEADARPSALLLPPCVSKTRSEATHHC